MKVRQDAWTEENDLLLAETVLRHVREGSTQLNAFEEVGDKLNRTSAACGFRWNAVVRHQYEKALQLAKKQRKQRQRLLGKENNSKKKLLYTPPTPVIEEYQPVQSIPLEEMGQLEELSPLEETVVQTVQVVQPVPQQGLTMQTVISFLQNFDHSNLQVDYLKIENERLKRELTELRQKNRELEKTVAELEQNSVTVQEDYETLVKIMNRARNLVLFDEEERPTTKFKMDRNGNLEKVAE